MRNDRQKAELLRLKGMSYRAISQKLCIPVSTLSTWFKRAAWSSQIKEKLSQEIRTPSGKTIRAMAEANRRRWSQHREQGRAEADQEFVSLRQESLFLAGLGLYWAIGDKVLENNVVKLSSADPDIVRVFFGFLKAYAKVQSDAVQVRMVLYPDLIENVQKNFWSRATGIPGSLFKKPIRLGGRSPKKRNSYGVCLVMANSRYLKEKICRWVELYRADL